MGALSELPFAAESAQSALFPERAQSGTPEYLADEEFPPDLAVKYDWMLQPASQRSLRRAMRSLAVTVATASIAVASYLVYHLPRLIVPVSVGLAGVIVLVVVIRMLSYVLAASPEASRQLRSATFDLKHRLGARLPRV
jgi:hypothetical protein